MIPFFLKKNLPQYWGKLEYDMGSTITQIYSLIFMLKKTYTIFQIKTFL
jgi:hypothetical protein